MSEGAQTLVPLVPITHEQEQAIETKRTSLAEAAEALVIDDSDSEALAWGLVNRIGELKKLIENDFADSKKAAHGAWKAICAQEAGHLERLKEPDKIVRAKLATWEDLKAKVLENARRRAEEAERLRVAEANRLAREKAEKEQRLTEAAEAERLGDKEKAEQLLAAPIEIAPVPEVVAAPIPTFSIPKPSNAGAAVQVWKFEIVDEAALPRDYLIPDEKAIRRVVEAMKGRTKIAGVRVWSETEVRRVQRRPAERYQHHDDPPRE